MSDERYRAYKLVDFVMDVDRNSGQYTIKKMLPETAKKMIAAGSQEFCEAAIIRARANEGLHAGSEYGVDPSEGEYPPKGWI